MGITGRTGSGKSTVLQLAMRMMDPTRGCISIDGTSLPEWELQVMENHVGYVPQDVFLFSDTIGNNIAFGATDNKPIEGRVRQAASTPEGRGCHGLEHGFDTLLGERGVNLREAKNNV